MSVWVFGQPPQGRRWYHATDGGNGNLDLFKCRPQGKAHHSRGIICRGGSEGHRAAVERRGWAGWGWLAGVHTLWGLCCPCICPQRERKKRNSGLWCRERLANIVILFLRLEKIYKRIAYDRTNKPLMSFSYEHQGCLHKQRDIEC